MNLVINSCWSEYEIIKVSGNIVIAEHGLSFHRVLINKRISSSMQSAISNGSFPSTTTNKLKFGQEFLKTHHFTAPGLHKFHLHGGLPLCFSALAIISLHLRRTVSCVSVARGVYDLGELLRSLLSEST